MTLAARTYGQGRSIVLLPGFRLDSSVMAAALEPAFETNDPWQRVYLDLPGTAWSVPVAPTSDAVLDAVQETVVAMFGSTPVLLVGHSYGGYLAAGLTRHAHEHVAGMRLISSGVKIGLADRDLAGVLPSAPAGVAG